MSEGQQISPVPPDSLSRERLDAKLAGLRANLASFENLARQYPHIAAWFHVWLLPERMELRSWDLSGQRAVEFCAKYPEAKWTRRAGDSGSKYYSYVGTLCDCVIALEFAELRFIERVRNNRDGSRVL